MKFRIAVGLVLGLLIQGAYAHEGLLPHSHAAESASISPLVIALVLAAVGSLLAGWHLSRKR